MEIAAVLGIEAAGEPEGEAIVEEVLAVERGEFLELFGYHGDGV